MRSTFVISGKEEGISLLQCLKNRFDLSGKSIKRSIEASNCFVNNRLERFASKKLKKGDRVLFSVEINKPLMHLLHEDPYFQLWEKESGFICDERCSLHRLDKETSGLLMTSQEDLFFDLFKRRLITKKYLAIVSGTSLDDQGEIDLPIDIIRQEKGKKIMCISDKGKYAITRWKVLKRSERASLLECEIVTGRTHQIRVHFSHIGYPVIGDYQYDPNQDRLSSRMLLHAKELSFTHPITKEPKQYISKMPKEFDAYMSS